MRGSEMGIIAGFMVPHPPMIVPDIGRGSEAQVEETTRAYERVADEIALHISRFFPRFNMTDRDATSVKHIYHLAEIAREQLTYVYTGNC